MRAASVKSAPPSCRGAPFVLPVGSQEAHSQRWGPTCCYRSSLEQAAPPRGSGDAPSAWMASSKKPEVGQSTSYEERGKRSASQSPPGVTRSPSRATASSVSVSTASTSQVGIMTPSKAAASVTVRLSPGAAPLLHRYRTSRASGPMHHTPLRSASLPPRADLPPFPSNLESNPVAPSKLSRHSPGVSPALSVASPQEAVVADAHPARKAPTSNRTGQVVAPRRARSFPSSMARSSTEGLFASAEVPLPRARVRLTAPSSSSSHSEGVTYPSASAPAPHSLATRAISATEATTEMRRQDGHGGGTLGGTKSGVVRAPAHTSGVCKVPPAHTVGHTRCCPDANCLHSEASICEYVSMQRELRQCYAKMERYVAAVRQLRDTCAATQNTIMQLQQQHRQGVRELEAQARAELEELMRRLIATQQRLETLDEDAHRNGAPPSVVDGPSGGRRDCATAVGSGHDAWRYTVEELRSALQAEQSSHANTRERLSVANAAKTRWKARAALWQKWGEQIHRRTAVEAASRLPDPQISSTNRSLPLLRDLLAADSPASRDSTDPAPLPLRSCGSSPIPRGQPPPFPHEKIIGKRARRRMDTQSPSAVAAASVQCVSTSVSERSGALPSKAVSFSEVAPTEHVADVSALSFDSSHSSSLPTRSTLLETEAVGSGAVVVGWPRHLPKYPECIPQRTEKSYAPSSSPGPDATLRGHSSSKEGARTKVPCHKSHFSVTASTSVGTTDERSGGCDTRRVPAPESTLVFPTASPHPTSAEVSPCRTTTSSPDGPPPFFSTAAIEIPDSSRLTDGRTPLSFPLPGGASTLTASDSPDARCKELLRALLDKERQLALVAEERTRYREALQHHSETTERTSPPLLSERGG